MYEYQEIGQLPRLSRFFSAQSWGPKGAHPATKLLYGADLTGTGGIKTSLEDCKFSTCTGTYYVVENVGPKSCPVFFVFLIRRFLIFWCKNDFHESVNCQYRGQQVAFRTIGKGGFWGPQTDGYERVKTSFLVHIVRFSEFWGTVDFLCPKICFHQQVSEANERVYIIMSPQYTS